MPAPTEILTTSERLDVVSPELALVDPGLAARARALLVERLEPPPPRTSRIATDVPAIDDALRRLVEAASDAEAVDRERPAGTRFRRWTRLVATGSAAAAGATLALQTLLGYGTL